MHICTWQPLTIGLAHLPRTFECLAAGFEAGGFTCFEAAGGCAPPGAEMGKKDGHIALHSLTLRPPPRILLEQLIVQCLWCVRQSPHASETYVVSYLVLLFFLFRALGANTPSKPSAIPCVTYIRLCNQPLPTFCTTSNKTWE